ncbi:MAG TPA: hypothetical protein VFN55_09855 [Solirubrobacteraceae bacterium]|nr:hypothetical protein [Solirubrobacteraceae bacterium]
MPNQSQSVQLEPRKSPRRRRLTTAVIAQYIQDLSRPAEPAPCPATA